MAKIEIASIEMQLYRKAIKNLHIRVLPPDGCVQISAPKSMTDTAIRMAVIHRIPWIKKQQSVFAKQLRQSEREMVSGECHYLWGRAYRLVVIKRMGKHEISIKGNRLYLYVNPETQTENKVLVLNAFYRDMLKIHIDALLPIWQSKMAVFAEDWRVKKMKTKWGSCNTQAKRIWLNLELAKKPVECLEYVLVHELVHLLERQHNDQFKAYMDKFIPNWRERRSLLNIMPLGHEHWDVD